MKKQALTPMQSQLLETMRESGCPLCHLIAKAEETYIASLNYERVLDLNTRAALKASRGLCAHHSELWERTPGSALGIAIVYRVTILDLLRDTDPAKAKPTSLLGRKSRAVQQADALLPKAACPACEVVRGTEERFAELLPGLLAHADAQKLLRSCGGLCLPHLRLTLSRCPSDAQRATLIGAQRDVWETLRGELEEFIRKNDYRFTHEKMTAGEGSSWTRALDTLTGFRRRKPR